MANPRQRRKNRSSSTTKPSLNAKRNMKKRLARAPTVKGADVLKDNWDPTLTARQNYAKLGLVPSLDVKPSSGGLERNDPWHASNLPKGDDGKKTKKGMAKIVRDEKGNVVEIIEHDDEREEKSDTPWGKPLQDPAENADGLETYMPPTTSSVSKKNHVVSELETLAASGEPVIRHTSDLENQWLHDLVAKYDDDYQAMAQDLKLNKWQKTQGEIKRAIRKAGGLEAIKQL